MDIDPVDGFSVGAVALEPDGADDAHVPSGITERQAFRPHSGIRRDRAVFDDQERGGHPTILE
jgi:hypothetical protein